MPISSCPLPVLSNTFRTLKVKTFKCWIQNWIQWYIHFLLFCIILSSSIFLWLRRPGHPHQHVARILKRFSFTHSFSVNNSLPSGVRKGNFSISLNEPHDPKTEMGELKSIALSIIPLSNSSTQRTFVCFPFLVVLPCSSRNRVRLLYYRGCCVTSFSWC